MDAASDYLQDRMSEKPLTTLLAAAGVGLLVGILARAT